MRTPREVEIELGDERFTLRPSFGALLAIEEKTDKSILELTFLLQGGLRLQHIITVLSEGSKAAGNELDRGQIVRLVEDYGIREIGVRLADFFAAALYSGKEEEQSKKKQALESNPVESSS